MTGRQNIQVNANAQKIEAPFEADARSLVDTAQIIDMNGSLEKIKLKKKRHTNTSSIIVGISGSSVIAYIIYNIILHS